MPVVNAITSNGRTPLRKEPKRGENSNRNLIKAPNNIFLQMFS
ncbi:hypothetical protein QA612_05030 [Evansella sp. AB-P1]|nr:hypothetical protein [Evansella sp. AB-P1]MDG5786847.1 hypothetical protein [Evansella sp. AB-P1]